MKLFELFATLTIDTSEFEKGVKSAQKEVKGFSKLSAMSASDASQKLEKLGKKAISIGKTVAVGATAIFSAVGAFAKKSLDEYADREQLVGGVETLFKDAAGTVERYARTAYKTAGMSANQYMETVTSFSARLMQGLGGDTKEAAEMANLAITDMSDNANKMGTDMASIEYAYQGFAKQNYTMLDNLKLGYGGTASEMARLINDSGVLGKTMTVTANNLNDVSFDTIIRAIHEIQTNMGITGTTAEEAEDTISGSFNTMKASWQNLLAGMSMDDSKIAHIRREEAFTESVETWLSNIKEPILNFIENLPDTLSAVLPAITDAAFDVGAAIIAEIYNGLTGSDITEDDVKSVFDNIKSAAGAIFDDLEKTLEDENVQALIEDAKKFASDLLDKIGNLFSVTFSIFMPDDDGGASTAGKILSWGAGVLTGVGNFFKALFSIFLPGEEGTMDDTETRIKNWWSGVVTALGNCIKAVFSIFIPDEDGKSTAGKILAWFANVLLALGNILLAPFGIDLPTAAEIRQKITNWWEGVIRGFSLQVGITTRVDANGNELPTPQEVRLNKLANAISPAEGSKTPAVSNLFGMLGIPGYSSGLDYVPYDDYIARLHQGEMVLTKNEANMWRSGQSGQQVNIAAITAAVANAIAERPVAINIDGKAFAAMTAKEMNRAIGNRNIQTLMGMGG